MPEATVVTSDPVQVNSEVVNDVAIDESAGSSTSQPNTAAELEQLRAEREYIARERDQYRQQLEPMVQQRMQQEQAQLDRMLDGLLSSLAADPATPQNPNLPPPPRITPQDQQALKQMVQAGVRYYQDAPNIRQERIAGMAINYAHDVLGDNVTVKELQGLANEFMSLGDPRLMGTWAQKLQMDRQNSSRMNRISSGIDSPVSSGAGAVRVSDPELIGRKIADSQPLTPMEKKIYATWRQNKGLPVPSGWL